MSSSINDVSRRLLPPVAALLALPAGTVVTNHFIPDDDDIPPTAASATVEGSPSEARVPLTSNEMNGMADTVERLITEITYVLSIGLVEQHELWTVLETLDLVPEKVRTEESIARAREGSATRGGRAASATMSAHAAPQEPVPSHNTFSRRIHFASQLVYVVQHTFKDFPAPVRTRALLRLALNQGCLLAALELLARYNRAEIAAYYKHPWQSVLLQYDSLDVRAPGLDPEPSAAASSSTQRVTGGLRSVSRTSTTTTTTTTIAVDTHQTPRRAPPSAASSPATSVSARASASPAARAPPPPPPPPPAAAQRRARPELWGLFVAALSPVGGVPLCALEDGTMTKGPSLIAFQLQLIVHGIDDDVPVSRGRAGPGVGESAAAHKCFLQQLGEYVYDVTANAPSAYACYRAVCAREKSGETVAVGRASPEAAAALTHASEMASATAAPVAVAAPHALVQVLATPASAATAASHTKRKRPKSATPAVVQTTTKTKRKKKNKDAAGAETDHPTCSSTDLAAPPPQQPLLLSSSSSSSVVSRASTANHARTQRHSTTTTTAGTMSASAALTTSAEAMSLYVQAVTLAETRAGLSSPSRPLVEQYRYLKRLSTLGEEESQAAPVRAVAPASSPSDQKTNERTTVATTTTPTAAAAHVNTHARARRAERGSFELLADGSVVRCATTPSPTRGSSVEAAPVAPTGVPAEEENAAVQHAQSQAAAVRAALAEVEDAVRVYSDRVLRGLMRREAIAMGRCDADANRPVS